jgi:hypothetical protein
MILNFEVENGKKYFEFCFVGFVLGGSVQDKKGMQILRTEVGLFEKFESISDLKSCGKKMINGEPERQLKAEGPRQLQLDAVEFDMLYNYMSQVPWQTGTSGRIALDTLTWLMESNKRRGDS